MEEKHGYGPKLGTKFVAKPLSQDLQLTIKFIQALYAAPH
jgi:hypothetical protein